MVDNFSAFTWTQENPYFSSGFLLCVQLRLSVLVISMFKLLMNDLATQMLPFIQKFERKTFEVVDSDDTETNSHISAYQFEVIDSDETNVELKRMYSIVKSALFGSVRFGSEYRRENVYCDKIVRNKLYDMTMTNQHSLQFNI